MSFEDDESQMYFAPALSGGSSLSLMGTSSRICAPRISPSLPTAGIRMPDVLLVNFTVQ